MKNFSHQKRINYLHKFHSEEIIDGNKNSNNNKNSSNV